MYACVHPTSDTLLRAMSEHETAGAEQAAARDFGAELARLKRRLLLPYLIFIPLFVLNLAVIGLLLYFKQARGAEIACAVLLGLFVFGKIRLWRHNIRISKEGKRLAGEWRAAQSATDERAH